MTMGKRIVIIDGHPDGRPERYVHALARAYREGAEAAGHEVADIEVAKLIFPLLRKREDFEEGIPPAVIRRSQDAIKRADHLLIVYPLWLGSMPAALKAFFEQAFRPGFAFAAGGANRMPRNCSRASPRASWSPWGCPRSSIAGISARTASRAWRATFSASLASGQSGKVSSEWSPPATALPGRGGSKGCAPSGSVHNRGGAWTP